MQTPRRKPPATRHLGGREGKELMHLLQKKWLQILAAVPATYKKIWMSNIDRWEPSEGSYDGHCTAPTLVMCLLGSR